MLLPTLVLFILAFALFLYNYQGNRHLEGVRSGFKQFLNILPILLLAFVLAGMLEALIPEEFVRRWLAQEAGLTGVFLGTLGGMLLAMGPYAAFPIIASIYGAGAGLGTTIALISSWTMLSLSKFPYELGVLGARFTITRMSLSVPFCIGCGALAHFLEVSLF